MGAFGASPAGAFGANPAGAFGANSNACTLPHMLHMLSTSRYKGAAPAPLGGGENGLAVHAGCMHAFM